MLGRSARRDPSNGCRGATNRRAACGNGKTPNCHRPKAAKRRSTTIRRRRTTSLPSHGRGGPQQARIAIANRNAAENAEQWFTANVNAVHLVRNVGRSLRGTLAGLRCGRLRPARLEESNNGDCKSFVRTGCDRPTSTTLLCHSERSEESFPLRTKGRLRTMPSKEEKDKRSAVKNLSTHTFIQILRRSMTSSE